MASGRRQPSWGAAEAAEAEAIAAQQLSKAVAVTLAQPVSEYTIKAGIQIPGSPQAASLKSSGSFKSFSSLGSSPSSGPVSELAANLARARAYEKAQQAVLVKMQSIKAADAEAATPASPTAV